jgi:hypothetical protein
MPITQILLTAGNNTPTYTLQVGVSVDEGTSLQFTVGGTNITNGTYYWTIETNSGDFATISGSIEVINNGGNFTVTPTADDTTEGSETFTVSLRRDSITGTVLVTSSAVTINDTSVTPTPTYTLTPSTDSVNEGSDVDFNVGGTNIVNGTYYWTIATNAGDFSPSSGEFTILDNAGSFTVTPTADATEDDATESFTVQLRSGSITGTVLETSNAITINDTSQPPTPTYTLTALGSLASATSVDEGSSATFEVGGTNIVDGTYYWTIESNSEDFATSNGEFSIASNTGSFNVVPTTDDTTEGEQTFTVSIRSVSTTGTVLATSDPFTINDTSLDPITYEVTPAANNVDEGSSLEFTVSGTNIPDDTYYWTIETGSSEFATTSGSFTITSNAGSFTVTPTADESTEGADTFTLVIRSGSITGTELIFPTSPVTINDTSLDPVPPFSMAFTGAGTRRLAVQYFQSDWNLGTTWTLEWWSKTTTTSLQSLRTVMSQAPSAGNIDVYYENGNLRMSNGTLLWVEPPVGGVPFGSVTKTTDNQGWGNDQIGILPTTGGTGSGLTVSVGDSGSNYSSIVINNPGSGYTTGDVITVTSVDESVSDSFTITASVRGIWTHVALSSDEGLVTVYYNGIEQNSAQRNLALTDSTQDLYIGRRGNNDFQYFDGNLALIRISEVARYATAFSPSVSYGVDADTLLFLGTNNPLADLSTYELNGVATVGQNGGQLYFSKSAYPNLDKQVQAGNTVTNTSDSTTSVVTGAVFTPDGDPDNWGINVSPPLSFAGTVNFSGVRHTITNTGVVRTNDVPSFQSLQFVESQGDYLEAAGSSDFNLGTTWTMEFWLNANAASTGAGGGIWGLLNQLGWSTTNSIVVALSDAKLVFLSVAANANADVRYTEPTPGQWTHVAVVNNEGTQTVWYNGVEQTKVSGTFGTASYTNGTDPLRIGRLGPTNGGTLDGKMAMVRISNTAKYAAAFTHTTTYGVEADTVLFLGKVNALNDSSSSDHNITNNGVATSTSFPQTLIGLIHPYGGGTFGTTYCLADNPGLAVAAAIPNGARITSNIAGFGTRTVTGNQSDGSGGRIITYDQTGLTGNTSTSHVFNFYWD